MNNDITYERLKELLVYHSGLGVFYNKVRRGNIAPGTQAGYKDADGYIAIRIDGVRYSAHRLAWLYEYGYFPENEIDHIDRNNSNNRITNLREVSKMCNQRNCGNRANNTTGVKGITWHKSKNKWQVQIAVNQHSLHVGRFDDFDEAVCHRLAVEQCLKWEGCDSSSPAFCYVQLNIINRKETANANQKPRSQSGDPANHQQCNESNVQRRI